MNPLQKETFQLTAQIDSLFRSPRECCDGCSSRHSRGETQVVALALMPSTAITWFHLDEFAMKSYRNFIKAIGEKRQFENGLDDPRAAQPNFIIAHNGARRKGGAKIQPLRYDQLRAGRGLNNPR